MTDVRAWVDKVAFQFIKHENNVNIILLDLGICAEEHKNLNDLKFSISMYHTSNQDEYKQFCYKLSHEYSLFIWGGDSLSPKYLNVVDLYLSSEAVKDKRVVFTPIVSNSDVYDPNSAFLKKLNTDKIPGAKVVFDCIYGKVIPTSMLLAAFKAKAHFPDFHYNGAIVLSDIISLVEDDQISYYLDNAIYKVHINASTTPSRGVSWDNPELFTRSFFNMVDDLRVQIDNRVSWQPMLQKVLLSIVVKYIKKGVTNQSLLDGLEKNERDIFIDKFKYAIELIGNESLKTYNISLAEHLKIGLLHLQGCQCSSKFIDLLQVDTDKKQVLIRYYSTSIDNELYVYNGKPVVPLVDKHISHTLFGSIFFYERRVWLQMEESLPDAALSVYLNGMQCKFKGPDKKIYDELTYRNIMAVHGRLAFPFVITEKYRDTWILMDRDNQADDNAEHLYRYLQTYRQDIDAWFVINQNSHDWDRLKNEGFKLLAFGSEEHEKALLSCSRILSSHAAQFATDYFKDKRMLWKKFIFLQHGIIHNDQSTLFRADWKKFDIFLTSAYDEYHSLVNDFSGYKFTAKEVALTGLPRHDALVTSEIKTEKMILVMPTWRPALLGKVIKGTERELLADFNSSEYAVAWFEFLNDPRLAQCAREHNYKIVFFPHANIQPYLHGYQLPEHVEVLSHASGSIQELFLKAAIMVTDYSSVAFEMAYLNKPVCYYQFDEESFFLVGHYNKGYFSYRDNGFGPVSTSKDEIIDFVIDSIDSGCRMQSPYAEKAINFFPYRDGKCCERVVNTVSSLDDRDIDDNLLFSAGICKGNDRVFQWAEKLYRNGHYSSAVKYLDDAIDGQRLLPEDYAELYVNALIMCGDINRAHKFIAINFSSDKGQYKSLQARHAIVSAILHGASPGEFDITVNGYDGHLYNLMFSRDSRFTLDNQCDYIELAESLHQQALSSVTVGSINNPILNYDIVLLKLHELTGDYGGVIQCYALMDMSAQGHIVAKYLYLNALFELNKWSDIQDFIGSDPILLGRTGLVKFAACHFMAANGSHNRIENINDYQYLLAGAAGLDDSCIIEILKYYLYSEGDLDTVATIVDECAIRVPTALVEDFSVELCKINQSEIAYRYLKLSDASSMSVEGLALLGHLAMAYGDYELAVNAFKQAYLSRLPVSDADLFEKLSVARRWSEHHLSSPNF